MTATKKVKIHIIGYALLATVNINRRAYGFEVNKEFVDGFYEKLYPLIQPKLFV